jgi:extradiol dioxygenase family protein
MKIKGIGFVAIPVTDVKRARSFYEEVLGLNSFRRNDGWKMDRVFLSVMRRLRSRT